MCIFLTGGIPINLECKTTSQGEEYMGTISVTASGKTCQAWTATSPHDPQSAAKTPSNFPDASIVDASNYCRNPDGDSGPWCYTMDPSTRWEDCDVPCCDGEQYVLSQIETGYCE